MKFTYSIIGLLLLAVIGNIMSCSSSTAQQDRITAEEVQAIVADAVAPLNGEIAALKEQVASVEEKTAHTPLFLAGAPNPVQIAALYPVYFESDNCTGQAVVQGGGSWGDIGLAAVRQGIAFRYTLPGQTDEAPETYSWLPKGAENTTIVGRSALHGAGNCQAVDIPAVVGFPVEQQMDAEAYETLTGIPAGGFLEGTKLTTFVSMPEGGLIGGRFYDTITSTGFYVRFDAASEPLVARIRE